MAGAKGRSGGARSGAGRKPIKPIPGILEPQPHGGALKRPTAAEPVPVPDGTDMLTLLQDIALGKIDATTVQVRAAVAAVQYTHAKRGEGGKKDARTEKAAGVAKGRYSPGAPPLRVVGKS